MTASLSNPIYHNEDKAREHLEALRWPNGPICPHCGVVDNAVQLQGKSTRPGVYKCRDCRKPFSATVGTAFERSKIPLTKWLLATALLSSSKKGMSSHQIHRTLGVTYKTAWFMTHRIREAMREEHTGPLGEGGGTVEADETFGNERKPRRVGKKGRGYAHKTKVLTLVERNGKARSFHVQSVNAATLAPILREQISADARLMTDEGSQYTVVGRDFASHGVTSHGIGEYVRGDIHSNTVESYFSIFKRGLMGAYHHVSETHLKRYLCEFDFRHNYRTALGVNDAERAVAVLKGIAGKRLTYKGPDQASA